MILWRIAREPWRALDGEGARLYGGRWNSEGNAVVYLASSLSLAVLELLVHVDISEAPRDLIALEVEVPPNASSSFVDVAELPPEWNHVPDHPACTSRGDAWVRDGATLLLRVPSAVIPVEANYLLNPKHALAGSVIVSSAGSFSLDPRLMWSMSGTSPAHR